MMPEELHTASSLLRVALDRYIVACATYQSGCSHKRGTNNSAELSNVVANELELVDSYKNKLTLAQASVKKARNDLANIPTNVLPDEVLAHIFQLVLAEQPCPIRVPGHWSSGSPIRLPSYPDTLAHVCSRWRQVALDSHGLWAHIDIALSCPLSQQFHNRAVAYVARARQSPLDVHFIDPGHIRHGAGNLMGHGARSEQGSSDDDFDDAELWDDSMCDNNPTKFTFLSSSPEPYIRSLGLLVRYQYHYIHNIALEHCLLKSLPRGLSQLIIDVPLEGNTPSFFLTAPNRVITSSVEFSRSLSEEHLESSWRPTTSLVLKGRYPRWTSIAYHGLTELRLLGKKDISSSELVCVLESSPGLRIFQCDFNIRDAHHSGALNTSVPLQDLRNLDVKGMYKADVERFLQWLVPGPEPLRLSISGDLTSSFEDFFMRSNVTEIRVESRLQLLGELQLPPNMYHLPPQLKILELIQWGSTQFFRGGQTYAPPDSSYGTPGDTTLDVLYMIFCCYISFTQFRDVVARFSPRKLVLWRCQIGSSASSASHISLPFLVSELGRDLSQLCPSIQCLSRDDPNPLQGSY